jgi:hypothetical protein
MMQSQQQPTTPYNPKIAHTATRTNPANLLARPWTLSIPRLNGCLQII